MQRQTLCVHLCDVCMCDSGVCMCLCVYVCVCVFVCLVQLHLSECTCGISSLLAAAPAALTQRQKLCV